MSKPLSDLQRAVEESKTNHQRLTTFEARALFLGTEVGEVQKEVLKVLGCYGNEKAVAAKESLMKELCDVIWNVCDIANMAGVQLDEHMQRMLDTNKKRVWENIKDAT